MADDMEKSEEPSLKKLEDAKLEGNVPRSQDVNSFITLMVSIVALYALFYTIQDSLFRLYNYYISLMGTPLTSKLVYSIGLKSLYEITIMVIPIALIVALSGIIAGVIQFGFIFTTKPLEPKLSKIDPIKGSGKLFSIKTLIEGIKITLKVFIVFIISFIFLVKFTIELKDIINFEFIYQIEWLVDRSLILIVIMLILFFIFAIIDLFIVRFQYFKDLRMSKQEVKDEYKQMEGDPQVKSRIKKLQMELAQKRMMSDIPSADVIITNPTHYAIALRYDKTKEKAPRVVAKGVDHLALKIKEIGREHLIQIVENPPLARELYKKCDVDSIIPDSLYQAVAELLAFVYKTKNRD
jgi:flagellar biosynthetic protein FlhB